MPWVPGVPATSTGYQLLVDGVNVLPYVPIDEQPIRWEDEAGNSVASMTFLAEDTKSWATRLPLDTGADVRFRDVANDVTLFGGTLLFELAGLTVRGVLEEIADRAQTDS